MKSPIVLALLVICASSVAQSYVVFIRDRSGNAEQEEHVGAVVGSLLLKQCSDSIHLTRDKDLAELIMEPQPHASTLLNTKGEILYISSAAFPKGMAKDVCKFLLNTH